MFEFLVDERRSSRGIFFWSTGVRPLHLGLNLDFERRRMMARRMIRLEEAEMESGKWICD